MRDWHPGGEHRTAAARPGRNARPTVAPPSGDGILVVGPAWVGDMVLAQSLFKALKRRHPERRLDVLAPGWTLPLLDYMPEVDGMVPLAAGHGELKLGLRFRTARRLRVYRHGWAIVLPSSFKAALIPFWARIPRRTGYVGEARWGLLNDPRRLDPRRLPRTVDRFVALAAPRGAIGYDPIEAPSLAVEPHHTAEALAAVGLARPSAPVLALCPGAEYGPAKRWPPEHFGALARRALDRGWAVWLFGSPADRESATAIRTAAGPGCTDLTGRTQLGHAIALLALADAVVSNDSGLMHVAAALGRRLVAVYGSSSPAMTPPLSSSSTVLRLGLPCSPCFKRECPLGHLACLRDLTPELVADALDLR